MLKKLMNMKKKKGFTLIELIVVLVIMAILAAAAIPTMMGYVDKARANQYLAEARAVYVAATAGATEGYGKGGAPTKATIVPATSIAGTEITINGADADAKMPQYVNAAVQDVCKDTSMQGAQFAVAVDQNGAVTAVEYLSKDGKYFVRITPRDGTKESDAVAEKAETTVQWTIKATT